MKRPFRDASPEWPPLACHPGNLNQMEVFIGHWEPPSDPWGHPKSCPLKGHPDPVRGWRVARGCSGPVTLTPVAGVGEGGGVAQVRWTGPTRAASPWP